MKKIISTILCISLVVSIICIPVSAISERTGSSDISGFINGINELTQKYDADKDFEVASENISSVVAETGIQIMDTSNDIHKTQLNIFFIWNSSVSV